MLTGRLTPPHLLPPAFHPPPALHFPLRTVGHVGVPYKAHSISGNAGLGCPAGVVDEDETILGTGQARRPTPLAQCRVIPWTCRSRAS